MKAFNHSRFKGESKRYYTEEIVQKNYSLQVEILEWFFKEFKDTNIIIPIISPFMDLNFFAQTIANTNDLDKMIGEFTNRKSATRGIFHEELILKKPLKDPILEKEEIILEHEKFIDLAKASPILSNKIPMVYIIGPLTLLAQLISPEKLLLQLVKKPNSGLVNPLLNKWLEYTTKCLKSLGDYLLKLDFKVFCILEPIACYFDNIRFKQMVLNPLNSLIDFFKKQSCDVILHACGNTTHLFNSFSKLKSLDAFNLDQEVSLMQFAKLIKSKIIIGNSNNKTLFLEDEKELFYQSIKMQLINSEIEDEGRYIPGTGCEITLLDDDPIKALRKLNALLKGYDPLLRTYLFQEIDKKYKNEMMKSYTLN